MTGVFLGGAPLAKNLVQAALRRVNLLKVLFLYIHRSRYAHSTDTDRLF